MKKEISKQELETITELALNSIIELESRKDTERHRCDDEDFLEVSIWEL